MLKANNTEFYVFGEFRLDARNRLLWRGDSQIGLSLREFEVLFFFVERFGQVIEKNELHEAIWKDTFIEDGTLTQNISRLRKKLEAASGTNDPKKIIETLPKRGYRFLPTVTIRQITEPFVLSPLENAEELTIEPYNSSNDKPQEMPVISHVSNQVSSTNPRNPKSKIQNLKLFWLGLGLVMIIVAVTLFIWKNSSSPRLLVAANVMPFSGVSGSEDTPAFSADGKQLVYTWNNGEGTQTDIYVRLTAGGEPVRLTETAYSERYPIFSPDGASVAFVRDFKTHGEVILIPALGGTERRICNLFSGNYSISFAPDGKSIAVIDTEDSTDKKQFSAYLVNIASGARRRLTIPAEFLGETTPRFAPDGKSIAFVRVFDFKNQDLFVVPVDEGENAVPHEPRQITFDKKIIHSLAWNADGTMIFIISFRGSNRAGLWRVSAKGGEIETVLTGGREMTNLAISTDGKTIAFVENAPRNLDLWQTLAEDSEQKPNKFLASTFNEFNPAFAPDDASVIFTSNRSGKNELWAVDRKGKNLRQLTKTEVNIGRSAVSPDGKQVAFEAGDNFASGIFTTEIETGATQELIEANGSLNSLPMWSADGNWIYFTSNRSGNGQIWKTASKSGGNEAVQITKRGGYQSFSAPDGTLLFSKSATKVDFWEIPPNGEGDNERAVSEIAGLNKVFGWTANRKGIYFFAQENEDIYEPKFYDFSSRQIRSVSSKIRLPTRILNSSAVSSDGKQYLSTTDNINASNIMFAVLQ